MNLTHRTDDEFAAEMGVRKTAQRAEHELPRTTHVAPSGKNDDNEIVQHGIEAANRLAAGHHWSDWMAVGRAVAVGRTEAMREAHVNRPRGRGYAEAMHRWLERNDLARAIGDKGARARLLDLVDHLSDIEQWRNTLAPEKQLELNHPNTVWRHWKKSQVVPNPNKRTTVSPVAQLKASLAEREEEVARLREANGGNLFTANDRPADLVKILRATFSANKLKEIRKLLGKEVTS